MRISHKNKFVFISKPKCASESIRSSLNKYSDILSEDDGHYYHHSTALAIKIYFEKMGWAFNDYFKFISIRNPWDLMVSFYYYSKPDKNGIFVWEKKRLGVMRDNSNLISFKNWIMSNEIIKSYNRVWADNGKIQNNVWTRDFSMLRLETFIFDEKKNILVDKIIKVENLNSELEPVYKKIGIGYKPLAKTNTTKHDNYVNYYNSEMIKKLKKEFEYDIYIGKYVFGK